MRTLTFDTHAFIKRLTASGMPEAQAEAVTALVKEAQDNAAGGLATKGDLTELKFDLLKWVVGLALAQMGLVVGVLLKLSAGH